MFGKKNRKLLILIAIILVVIAVFIIDSCQNRREANYADGIYYVDVHFIDVGQGDSTLICTPDENILIDTGTDKSEVSLVAYLDKLGIDVIDYIIISHPHADHIGGADEIVESFDVENIVLNGVYDSGGYAGNLTDLAEERSIAHTVWEAGDFIEIGELDFYVLAPLPDSYDEDNNSSLVIKMVYGDSSFLFTGDAEKDCEKEMLDTYNASMLDCDVLKVGHHGSKTSSSAEFIAVVSPALSIISCAAENRYGHPHLSTLKTLEDENSMIWRIDEAGSVVVRTDGGKIFIPESVK
jgi:competence protein ComEC